jgi:hypothetical protein
MRLSYGPYEREGSVVPINKTRLQFLWNARARVPAIASDLHEKCFPLYQEFLKSQRSHALGWTDVKTCQNASELRDQLDDWSIRYGVNAEWCKRWAVTAMKAWFSDEESLQSLSWAKDSEIVRYILFPEFYPDVHFSSEHLRELRWVAYQLGLIDFGFDDEPCFGQPEDSYSDFGLHDQPCSLEPDTRHPQPARPEDSYTVTDSHMFDPPLGLPRWWFTATSRDEYLRDVEAVAQKAIETVQPLLCVHVSRRNRYVEEVKRVAEGYCSRVEKYLSTLSNWKKAKVFVDHRAHVKHIVWAVMFQVQRNSYSEIARAMGVEIEQEPSVSTVMRGIDEILNMIGLDNDRRAAVRRGPKAGSVHSESTKASNEILRSLGL